MDSRWPYLKLPGVLRHTLIGLALSAQLTCGSAEPPADRPGDLAGVVDVVTDRDPADLADRTLADRPGQTDVAKACDRKECMCDRSECVCDAPVFDEELSRYCMYLPEGGTRLIGNGESCPGDCAAYDA